MTCFMIFQTAFGAAGLAWAQGGLTRVAFPQADEEAVRAVFKTAQGVEVRQGDAPADILTAAQKISALFNGAQTDFGDIVLDDTLLAEFDREVLALIRAIPQGQTRTYGEIAKALGDVSLSRQVGQVLGRNPWPVIVPCHRVVGADGKMTGFSAPGGAEAKRRLLKLEGALAPELFD